MNWAVLKSIARHDVTLAIRNKALVIPMAITATVFLLIVPIGVAITMSSVSGAPDAQALQLLARFPANTVQAMPDVAPADQLIYLALVHLIAPLFMTLPVMLASVLAADSFAGERERKTLEYLLNSPATDRELVVGKMLAAWLPALSFAAIGVAPYLLVANSVLEPIVGPFALPNTTWLVLLFGVIPGASAMTLGISVLISSKVDSFQAAYQAGPLVTFPFMGLMVTQLTGGVFLDAAWLFGLSVVLWLAAAVVLTASVRSFKRTKLFAGGKRSGVPAEVPA